MVTALYSHGPYIVMALHGHDPVWLWPCMAMGYIVMAQLCESYRAGSVAVHLIEVAFDLDILDWRASRGPGFMLSSLDILDWRSSCGPEFMLSSLDILDWRASRGPGFMLSSLGPSHRSRALPRHKSGSMGRLSGHRPIQS